ncbi:NPC intracellular cholesterol transporter 2-like [Ruditapes philippinarum]|uniref:NPC intracellular cholesterol transporter 2-like n=1 Tax=Ruditapes philippinarum TaxID=129788 RepID=UPI00295C39E6|nr:NPC intracellular cholesterol transporter 2-like [Ruditapes philippinarum]
MSPCPSLPCVFHKGTNATVTIDFTTDKQVSGITTKVYGIVAGVPIPYSLPKSNGCQGCNLICPLTPGTHRYVNVFPVLKTYPEIRLAVKWELVDENNEPLLCFVFPMQILD